MKGLSRLLLAVNVLLASGVAAFVASWALNWTSLEDLRRAAEMAHDEPSVVLVVLLSVLFIANNVFMFLIFPVLWGRDEEVLSSADGTEVSIALSAIESSLLRTARGTADVQDVRLQVTKATGARKPLRIHCSFSTWEGTDVKAVAEQLKNILRIRFRQIVGEPQIPPVFTIRLSRIVPREDPRSKRGAGGGESADPESRTGYRRPEYPIDSPLDAPL